LGDELRSLLVLPEARRSHLVFEALEFGFENC
jgi:hypothetical protein